MPVPDLNDPEAVRDQIITYCRLCSENDIKPSVVGMATALHLNRMQLWSIVTGQPYNSFEGVTYRLSKAVTAVIREWYGMFETMHIDYTTSGKINPVPALFLAKNFFGYRDVQEVVTTSDSHD